MAPVPDLLSAAVVMAIMLLFPLALAILGCQKTEAVCLLEPDADLDEKKGRLQPRVSGTVHLMQRLGAHTVISYRIEGLTPGAHGFHIYEKPDFSRGLESAGQHFNPFGDVHGAPCDLHRHVGDLGNVLANEDGVAVGKFTDPLIMLSGPHSVIGRAMVVHCDADDLGLGDNSNPAPTPINGKCSLVTGNAGSQVAWGEISLTSHGTNA
ncbi:hypothetical protein AB1Y20_011535 [Prymnesium parvum]|uniref:Superoxide dismutase copper/zinc binding domain-containing protein n=1 Tax=Prymnesium parvum TaxID=97485 RepID=A0AB34IIH6_PRYPA